MKRVDRMITVFSIFLLKLAVIYGLLFYFDAEPGIIFTVSVIGLLLIIFYLFGEIVAVEITETKQRKKERQVQRKLNEQKRKLWKQSLAGFRKIFGGEDYVE